MISRPDLADLERHFLVARKEYLDQVEAYYTAGAKGWRAEEGYLKGQCELERFAFDRYSKARFKFLGAYAAAVTAT